MKKIIFTLIFIIISVAHTVIADAIEANEAFSFKEFYLNKKEKINKMRPKGRFLLKNPYFYKLFCSVLEKHPFSF